MSQSWYLPPFKGGTRVESYISVVFWSYFFTIAGMKSIFFQCFIKAIFLVISCGTTWCESTRCPDRNQSLAWVSYRLNEKKLIKTLIFISMNNIERKDIIWGNKFIAQSKNNINVAPFFGGFTTLKILVNKKFLPIMSIHICIIIKCKSARTQHKTYPN